MGDIQQQCKNLQDDELSVLESIYPGCIIEINTPGDHTQRHFDIDMAIALPSPIATRLIAVRDRIPAVSADSQEPLEALPLTISHLPNLKISVTLPWNYPLDQPPLPTTIRAPLQGSPNDPSHSVASEAEWLESERIATIRDKLEQMWLEEREMAGEAGTPGVLWRWWQWVSQGEFLHDLGLFGADGSLELPVPFQLSSVTLHSALVRFNDARLHASFEETAFPCAICFESRKGKRCLKLPGCGCVFCTTCLHACWSLAITEGSLENVSCPDPDCVKRRANHHDPPEGGHDAHGDLPPELVESVVGKPLRDRFERLKDVRRAEIDPAFTFCPLPSCEAGVPPPAPSSTKDARWDSLRVCPRCQFAFCARCLSTWHGPHTECQLSTDDRFLQDYLRMPVGSMLRRSIERRLGKETLTKMINRWKENRAAKSFITTCTAACPGCEIRVQKSYGCNHMRCIRCWASFCYRCGEKLSRSQPYKHFNVPGKFCFGKLFELEDLLREEVIEPPTPADDLVDQWVFPED